MLCLEEKTHFSTFMIIASCLLFSACATIEYPGTGGVYGGGYYPVFGPGNYGWTPRVLCN